MKLKTNLFSSWKATSTQGWHCVRVGVMLWGCYCSVAASSQYCFPLGGPAQLNLRRASRRNQTHGVGGSQEVNICVWETVFSSPSSPPFLFHSPHLALPPGTPLTLYPVCFFLSVFLGYDVGRHFTAQEHTHTHKHSHHGALDWWFPLLHAYAMALFIIIHHFTIPTPLAIHMGIIILWCGCRVHSTED